jgi:hypothetical protein
MSITVLAAADTPAAPVLLQFALMLALQGMLLLLLPLPPARSRLRLMLPAAAAVSLLLLPVVLLLLLLLFVLVLFWSGSGKSASANSCKAATSVYMGPSWLLLLRLTWSLDNSVEPVSGNSHKQQHTVNRAAEDVKR